MSNVNAGVFNFPQILRRLGHRTKQVRDVVFVRDAIFEKSVGTHIDTDGSPGGGAGRTTRLSGPPVNFGYENTNSTEAIAANVDSYISFTDATCDYNNDPTITHDSNTEIRVGQFVSGTGIPTDSTVASVTSATEFELSASTTGGSVTNGTLTFNGKDTVYYVDSPEIVLPGIKTYQSPIVSRVGKLERTGHRITGACTFHIPPLSIIKSLDNFSDCKAFSEIETYDTFFDIERSIVKPTDTGAVTQQTTTFTMAANQPGYEVDRLQFKIKTAGVLDYILLTGLQNNASATLKWDGNLTLSTSDFITVDLPISKVSDGDTTSIYKDGTRSEYTADTNDTGVDFDIDKMFGDSQNKLQTVIVQLTASVAVEIKDIYLYKACEWRIENIKDYRDEYMAIGAVRVRGDRTSRRRAYG